ncbi:hypothetical protein D3C76_1595690 [compost metagenome]
MDQRTVMGFQGAAHIDMQGAVCSHQCPVGRCNRLERGIEAFAFPLRRQHVDDGAGAARGVGKVTWGTQFQRSGGQVGEGDAHR